MCTVMCLSPVCVKRGQKQLGPKEVISKVNLSMIGQPFEFSETSSVWKETGNEKYIENGNFETRHFIQSYSLKLAQ